MYEMLVGLEVIDDKVYQAYRDAMGPILKSYGGSFGYDFRVSEVLKNESEEDINRVFTIRFPTEAAKDSILFGYSLSGCEARVLRCISQEYQYHIWI